MSRRPHEPSDASRQLVNIHSTIGTRHDTLARLIGIDVKTMYKYYRDELDLGMARANAVIGGALFNKAKNGDTTAQIFWMKTRCGWRETNVLEHTGTNGGPIQTEISASDILSRRLDAIAARAAGTTEPE